MTSCVSTTEGFLTSLVRLPLYICMSRARRSVRQRRHRTSFLPSRDRKITIGLFLPLLSSLQQFRVQENTLRRVWTNHSIAIGLNGSTKCKGISQYDVLRSSCQTNGKRTPSLVVAMLPAGRWRWFWPIVMSCESRKQSGEGARRPHSSAVQASDWLWVGSVPKGAVQAKSDSSGRVSASSRCKRSGLLRTLVR